MKVKYSKRFLNRYPELKNATKEQRDKWYRQYLESKFGSKQKDLTKNKDFKNALDAVNEYIKDELG